MAALSPETQKLFDNIFVSTNNDELLENIRQYVKKFTGWKEVTVELINGMLDIRCETGCLLSFKFDTNHEVYGRYRHVGFTFSDMLMIRHKLTA